MTKQRSLFAPHADDAGPPAEAPLADRMRPRTLDEVVGQAHLIGPQGVLRAMVRNGRLRSMILWGPPGTGKTTLARLLCRQTGYHFSQLSAVNAGLKDLRATVEDARARGGKTALFVDEIHRWNKAQQDSFLPHVEQGTVTLIGATTENPSFEVIGALLSRCAVYTLQRLTEHDLRTILRRACDDAERGLGGAGVTADDDVLLAVAALAGGDARCALNTLELAADLARAAGATALGGEHVRQALQRPPLRHDKAGEAHYNLLSALHKSLRGSDPDAAVYWLVRILASGEDGLSAARRMIACASEDVGNADPRALMVAVAAFQAYHALGSPEGDLPLAHAALYIATAPKSNGVVAALDAARALVEQHGDLPVPLHLRNAPTGLMKALNYGKEYRYAHDDPDGIVNQTYLPEPLLGATLYRPTDRGYEKTITKRLAYWRELIAKKERNNSL